MAEDLTPKRPITPDLARQILQRFITEEEVKRRFATKSREALHAQIDRGEAPTGHRAEWVAYASEKALQAVMVAAQEFNATYPYDVIILGDFLDVIATTRGRIIAKGEGAP